MKYYLKLHLVSNQQKSCFTEKLRLGQPSPCYISALDFFLSMYKAFHSSLYYSNITISVWLTPASQYHFELSLVLIDKFILPTKVENTLSVLVTRH